MGGLLGSGGFGEVYAATMASDGGPAVPVAIKIVRDRVGASPELWRRLVDESRILRGISHPNIVAFHTYTRVAGREALVTDLVEGIDLSTCMKDEELPLRAVAETGAAVAEALDAAYSTTVHGQPVRIVHRDVKPSNVRLTTDGRVVLLDFGIAYSDQMQRASKTATDALVGTPRYLTPEAFRGAPPQAAMDVFALGVTLYEVLYVRPFHWLSLQQQAYCAASAEQWRGFIDERLEVGGRLASVPDMRALLRAMMEYEPEARPSARTVANACRDLAMRLKGTGLEGWAAERVWPAVSLPSGALSGRELAEDPLHTLSTDVPFANLLPPLPAPEPVPTALRSAPSAPTTAARTRSHRGGLYGALAGLGLLAGGSVGLVLWLLTDEPSPIPAEPSPEPVSALVAPEPPSPTSRGTPRRAAASGEATPGPMPLVPVPVPTPVPTTAPSEAMPPVPDPSTSAIPRSAGPDASPRPARGPRASERVEAVEDEPVRIRVIGASAQVWATPASQPQARVILGAFWTELEPGSYAVWTRATEKAGPVQLLPSIPMPKGARVTVGCDASMACSIRSFERAR